MILPENAPHLDRPRRRLYLHQTRYLRRSNGYVNVYVTCSPRGPRRDPHFGHGRMDTRVRVAGEGNGHGGVGAGDDGGFDDGRAVVHFGGVPGVTAVVAYYNLGGEG